LTQAVASVLAAEPKMAADFVQLVFAAAPNPVDMTDLPTRLECRAEQVVAEGRADLSFVDEARHWHVLVEIKIYAGYGEDQVGRYIRSLNDAPRAALVAITRDVPTKDDSAHRDNVWAGSVQWSRLLPGLRALLPEDPDLRRQWPLFLDVLEEEGSMGFTRADAELFRAWAQFPRAQPHLVDFVDSLRRALLEVINHELAARAAGDSSLPADAQEVRSGRAGRVVTPRHGKIAVGYQIPAALQGERLRVGLWGWYDPRVLVEIPWPSDHQGIVHRADVIAMLREAGFESWRDKQLTRYLPLTDDLLTCANLTDRVIEFVAESVRVLASSGVFALVSDALEAEPPVE
jgi:hypothetical protein